MRFRLPLTRRLTAAALLLAPALLGAQSAGAPRPAPIDRATEHALEARYQAAADSGRAALGRLRATEGIPGLSVAVLVDGRIVWSEGLGYADLEGRVPATPLTRFRIASISKPVTAAALGLLVEQGRLDLDQPVQTYVRDYPRQRWPITTRQLAGHVAGVRHYARPEEMLSSRRYATVREALAIFERDSLLFEPGTRYNYSTYGFNLLSAVVEGAAGEPFLAYMRRHVFAPLGLRSITAEHTDSLIPWRARFYDRGRDGRVTNAPYVDNSNKWAGGGFVSNSEDLARFGWAHVDGSLLKPATVTLLTTSQKLRSGEPTGYGIGWSVGTDSAGRRWYGHTGGATGGRSVLLVLPDQRVVVAAIANLGQAPMSIELAGRLAAPFVAARAAAATP
jgi:CubicO group peptidase (beta-lactamase class C family)